MGGWDDSLQSCTDRLDFLKDVLPAGYAATDKYLAVRDANKAFGRLFGTWPSRYLGKHIARVVKSQEFARFAEGLLQAGRRSRDAELDFRCPPRDGERHQRLISVRVRAMEAGGFVFRFQDEQGAQTMVTRLRRICEALYYELNKPVCYIRSLTVGLGDTPPEAVLPDLRGAGERMHRVLGMLKDYATLQDAPLEMKITALVPCLDQAHERLKVLYPGVELTILKEITPVANEVMGCSERLTELFFHLLHNVMKFVGPTGKAFVQITRDENDSLTVITDNGPGLDSSLAEQVCEAFYQEPYVPLEHGGVGLGLTLARQIAQLHGGDLELKCETGKGVTCFVRLPLAAYSPFWPAKPK